MIVAKATGGDDSGIFAFEINNNIISMVFNKDGAWHTTRGNTGLAGNVWYQVTATYDGSNLQVFLNGVLDGTTPYSQGLGTATIPWMIGVHPNISGGFIPGFSFAGVIDDIRIYSRALSQAEIQELYLLRPFPEIRTQPQSQVGYWGKSVSFSVSATNGIPPFSYQWLKGDAAIADATNSLLVLTNLQAADGGVYKVVIADAATNTLTSLPATLTVNPAGVSFALYAGVTIDGVVGQTYGVQMTTDLGNTNSWAGAANLTLTVPTQIWYDSNSTSEQPKRYYRVVAGPISVP